MEVSTSLLVALMFVGILSLGIANLLSAIADLARKRVVRSRLHIHWAFLLLFTHLNLFWSTGDAIQLEWRFLGFLFVICGPILLFTASHLMIAASPDEELDDASRKLDDRFLLVYSLVHVWMIIMVVKLFGEFTASTFFSMALIAVALITSRLRTWKQQEWATLLTWILVLSDQGLRGSGIIQ